MREDRFQHDFVMWFGQTWPEYSNLLFEVNNNPKSKAHGSYRKSMGMKKNVSDLILIQPNTGIICGLELKAPGSIHSKKHIANQLEWGNSILKNGGYYMMTSDSDILKKFVYGVIKQDIDYPLMEREMLKIESQFTKKTIKF